jgi:hypothetical protein
MVSGGKRHFSVPVCSSCLKAEGFFLPFIRGHGQSSVQEDGGDKWTGITPGERDDRGMKAGRERNNVPLPY